MKIINKALISAAAIAAMLGSASALAADEVYENSFRLGSYTVFYHTHADDVTGPFVPAGVNLKAQDLETLYVGYVRRLSSAFAVELALGYPPLNKVEAASLHRRGRELHQFLRPKIDRPGQCGFGRTHEGIAQLIGGPGGHRRLVLLHHAPLARLWLLFDLARQHQCHARHRRRDPYDDHQIRTSGSHHFRRLFFLDSTAAPVLTR